MLKLMKQLVIGIAFFSVLFLPISSTEAADNDFIYWYSDSGDCNEIRYWDISSIPTYFFSSTTVGNNLSVSNLVAYCSTSVVRRATATNNITYHMIPVSSSAPSMRIIPKTQGEAGTPIDTLALTVLQSNIRAVGTGYYNSELKTIYKYIGPIDIWPIYGPSTYNFTTSDWTVVMVHEWGHALGYAGHYSGGSVMYPTFTGTTYPNTNEINHLSQVYGR